MHYLLDTHVWLWLDSEPKRIEPKLLEAFKKPSTGLYLSSISCWEIVIKTGLNKLKLNSTPEQFFRDLQTDYQAIMLDFSRDHAVASGRLPAFHKDPFDRALVAQAQSEHLKLVTVDKQLAAYGSNILVI